MARSSLRGCAVLAAVALTAGRPTTARAGDSGGAEALFRQGRALAEAGDMAHACPEFAESLRLEPAPGTLLNLADCEERLGRLASAWEHFLRVEAQLGDGDERRELAHARALSLAQRVPQMTITLAPGGPVDARVFRDDLELGPTSLAVPLPVDAGAHLVVVTAPGHEPARFVAVAADHRQTSLVVGPGPMTPWAATPNKGLQPGWLVGGAGVLALGLGAYLGARALSERSASDASCSAGACTSAAGLVQYESARGDALASDVALGIGVAVVGIATYMLLTAGGKAPAAAGAMLSPTRVAATW